LIHQPGACLVLFPHDCDAARFFARLLPLLRNPLVRAVCYFRTTLTLPAEIDAIFVWGYPVSRHAWNVKWGFVCGQFWRTATARLLLSARINAEKYKFLYLYEYKGLIYFASTGVDRGCLGLGRDSGNSPHQVLVMVL